VATEADLQLTRIRQGLVWALIVAMVVLTLTGVYLFVGYRPSTGGAGWRLADGVRFAHRWVAIVTVLVAAVLAVVSVAEAAVRWTGPRQRRSGVVTGPAIAVLVLVASFTGTLLPWDQLALWAVTVGSDMSGFRPILDDSQVRFVLIGGSEVSTATVRFWLAVHAVVIPVAIGGCLALARRERPPT
jgi:quinol-cytochrome oxidoreductase complex cytochrome b subunit